MTTLAIKSTKGGRTLSFNNRKGDHFDAEISGDSISAKKKVWGHTDTRLLIDLFESLAKDWKGWEGERQWASIEGDLRLTATCDRWGHIQIEVYFHNNDPDDDWALSAPIFVDAGSLDLLAKEAKGFFSQK